MLRARVWVSPISFHTSHFFTSSYAHHVYWFIHKPIYFTCWLSGLNSMWIYQIVRIWWILDYSEISRRKGTCNVPLHIFLRLSGEPDSAWSYIIQWGAYRVVSLKDRDGWWGNCILPDIPTESDMRNTAGATLVSSIWFCGFLKGISPSSCSAIWHKPGSIWYGTV